MYQPQFQISNRILKNISLIEACREVIKNAPLVPAWERRFQEEAVVRQVHHGTHLEGNPLNYEEAAQVVAGREVVSRPRDVQEIINYRNVIKFIGTLAQEKNTTVTASVFDKELIKRVHRLTTTNILPAEKSGEIRTKQVVVRNSETGEVTFRPPAAVEVNLLLDDFIAWLKSPQANDVHPVLKSGIVQYELVRIHPFLDGNGRVARALAVLVLYTEGYDIRRFFSIEEYYDRDAEQYYQALQSVQPENGDYNLTPWLEYFTEGLAIELTRIREKIKNLSIDEQLKQKLGGRQIFLSDRQITIVEYLQKAGYLQNQQFKFVFPMVSEDTILRELKDLMEKRIIVKKGKTKGAKYLLTK